VCCSLFYVGGMTLLSFFALVVTLLRNLASWSSISIVFEFQVGI
jgi:hypothetical protein